MYFAINKNASPEALAIFGIFAILLSGFIGYLSIKELAALPSVPLHMTMTEALSKVSAKKELWVILDDIQWDCTRVYYYERDKTTDTYITFTDKNKIVLGLALFGGKQDCKVVVQKEIAGVLAVSVLKEDTRLYGSLLENGFDVASHKQNGTLLSFCTYCGRSNSLTGVFLSITFLVMGILLFIPLKKEAQARKNAQYFMKRNILRK
jgi:hypothetical protein